ncbi:alcohol dehydrogenase [Aphelenchoides fujianensis]|nr:alcohol dehydrogenase [Aphelenchoides fujianensis]
MAPFQQYAVVNGNVAAKLSKDTDLKAVAPVPLRRSDRLQGAARGEHPCGRNCCDCWSRGRRLGTMAIQYAKAMGFRPLAIDGSSKEKICKEMGAEWCRTRGTVVLVALPKDAKVSIDVFSTVFRAITVKGSYVGNRQDTIEAIDFFNRGLIKIPMEVEPLSQLPDVFKRMKSGEINGRIVLDLWK